MEDWQKSHIKDNLTAVIQNTTCTTLLKLKLREMGLISDEEYDTLTSFGKNESRLRETKELYNILITRKNGYEGLMEALQATRQTGAWNMLNQGILMNLKIQILSGTTLLKHFFPKLKPDDVPKLAIIDAQSPELGDLHLLQNFTLQLDGKLPQPRSLCIPRSLSNRLLVQSKVFKMPCRDIFVFQNIELTDLEGLVGDNIIRFSSTQQSLIKCRHIYLEHDEDWYDMELVAEAPLHLIAKEDNDYVLQRSTEVTDIIRENSTSKGKREKAYESEDEFIEQFISSSKGALLCDIPGMGKTWLMENLARKLGTHAEKTVVFYVQLSQFSQHLSELKELPSSTQTLNCALNYVGKSKLAVFLLSEHAERNGIKIVFFFDGFDEILSAHVENTSFVLEELSKHSNVRLVISSRSHMRKHLEDTFKLTSYDILPFSLEEQVSAISGHWQEKFPECDQQKLTDVAKECVKSMNKIRTKDPLDILGVPLKCYMLAKVNEKHAQRFAKPNRKNEFKVSDEARNISICNLYEKFIDNAIKKSVMDEKLQAEKEEEMWTFHTFAALQLLLPKIYEHYVATTSSSTSPSDEIILRTGLLIRTDQGNYEFAHRTFAEFLIGRFYHEFWKTTNLLTPEFVWEAAVFFVEKLLTLHVNEWDFAQNLDKIDFNVWRFEDIARNQTICEFYNKTVVRFMENKFGTITESEEWVVKIHGFRESLAQISKLESFKEVLAKHAYMLLISCCEERFTAMLCLIVTLLNVIFKGSYIPSLPNFQDSFLSSVLSNNYRNPDYVARASVPFLLFRATSSGNPEVMHQVRNLLIGTDGDSFLNMDYPLEFYSPLDIAIARNDAEMFIYCFKKVKEPRQRLFVFCLLSFKPSEEGMKARKTIFEHIINSDQNTFNRTSLSPSFDEYLASLSGVNENNNKAIINFAFKNKLRLNHLPRCYKKILFSHVCEKENDEVFITLLLHMFANVESHECDIHVTTTEDSESRRSMMDSGLVIEKLDIDETRNVFSHIRLSGEAAFRNLKHINTLKVLITLCPHFTTDGDIFVKFEQNYLHCAVLQGKVEWVEFLIENGYNIEEKDTNGDTPLLCTTTRNIVEITRLLVKYKVNMFAVNSFKENVAHRIFQAFKFNFNQIDYLYEWVAFMQHNGYRQLWELKDKTGITPFQALSKYAVWDMQRKKGDRGKDIKKLLFLFNYDFHINIEEYLNIKEFDIDVFLKFVIQEKMTLSNVKMSLKLSLLDKADLSKEDDRLFLMLLLLIFPKEIVETDLDTPRDAKIRKLENMIDISKTNGIDKLKKFIDFEAVEAARKILEASKKFCNHEQAERLTPFYNNIAMHMHYAVQVGNAEWVKFLLDIGYDVNETDRDGNTPLLMLSPKNPVKVARMLLQMGADIWAVNNLGQNAAFRLIEQHGSRTNDNVKDWVTFTLESGYSKLWTMKGKHQLTTPLELLEVYHEPENYMVQIIRANIKTNVKTMSQ